MDEPVPEIEAVAARLPAIGFREHALAALGVRGLQDEAPGFMSFIPLTFQPGNTGIPVQRASALEDARTIAASRLMLDNFEHIKTFWVMHTLKLSQIALHFGADDIDGTVSRYEIIRGDGGGAVSAAELQHLIREWGLTPVQRDSGYRPA